MAARDSVRAGVTTLAMATWVALHAPACGPAPVHVAGDANREAAYDAGLAAAFAADGATGTILIRRVSDGREWVHDPVRADSGFIPASTFKIVNAALALETGVVAGPEEVFLWDGVERAFDGWNRDHTLRTAMAASAVPVYQEVARRIGSEAMAAWLHRMEYGNADTGGGLDRFWLSGDLRISARQQVRFLTRFVTGDLPLSPETRMAVASMILNDHGDGWALHAKTGWAFDLGLGWWAGWTEVAGEHYVFALNMDMPDSAVDPPKRIRIGLAALRAVGALPSPAD
jgi:beta-lactamase class D